MLQQIQFHVHEDEEQQQLIEQSLALTIRENYRRSIGALERYIPTLAELVRTSEASVSTLLCNKYSELNIVNYNTGQVLYGMHPKEEVLLHYSEYISRVKPLLISKAYKERENVLVCLGLGLGYHLEHAVRTGNFKHIVVYEPCIDYFICSLSAIDWKELLQIAKEQDVALYLQIGGDGVSLTKDLQELVTHTNVSSVTCFKHLNMPVFNAIEEKLANSGCWDDIQKWQPRRSSESLSESYLPLWAQLKPRINADDSNLNEALKVKNLDVLKVYFPDLYREFVNYEPLYWFPTANSAEEVNAYHEKTDCLFSASSKNDAKISFDAFSRKPNKDGLLLSYTGKKLKGYLHYQLVDACEKVLKGSNEAQSELPNKVKSLIMFGLGNGYGVEEMVNRHDIEMLFICEPNKDFFFASLYAVDWEYIIKSFDDGKKRLYLNIGDDGSNLTNDLLVQFQTVGPYVLANTFFYQSYVNDNLTDAVARLREQLLVIIAMGDYFDNAKYGIAHTQWALNSKIPFLLSKNKRRLCNQVLDVPVFIVGNGPSLDGLIEVLKEERDKALVISCGTALQSLHRSGITPDFHAEIETNRSTFDWLSRIDDDNYLKQITLLSCNGVHPDSAALFGKTLLAFKQGESSTVSITELDKSHPFALMNYSYPTVTNFAADLVTEMGFTQVYLFGTDMGFVSDTYHHSKSSGYYDGSGEELYNYAENHAMSLVIPGNFKPWVKTKYEFKVSKGVLEQTFSQSNAEIYNLNDGAKILGAKALHKDFVLISSTSESKQKAKNSIQNLAFTSQHNEKFSSLYSDRYSTQSLLEELGALRGLLASGLKSSLDVDKLVSEQREFIVSSYLRRKSLAFYYLNGTFNYMNSMFSKLLNISDEAVIVELGNSLLSHWRRFIDDIILIMANDQYGLDNISPFIGLRRNHFIADETKVSRLHVKHKNVPKPIKTKPIELLSCDERQDCKQVTLNWLAGESDKFLALSNTCNIDTIINRKYFSKPLKGLLVLSKGSYKDVHNPYQSNPITLTNTALYALLSGFSDAIFLQKVSHHPLIMEDFFDDIVRYSEPFKCYSGPDYIVLTNNYLQEQDLVLPTGDRLVYLPRMKVEDLRYETISDVEHVRRVRRVDETYHEFNGEL